MNLNQEERDLYEDHLKWMRIEANTLKKYGAEEHERGKLEGIEIGEARGIELGEKAKAIAIARQALQQGLTLELIQVLTGLTLEEIQKLNNNDG